jgi:hypothetical protein
MATNIDELIQETDKLDFDRNPTVNLLGFTVDLYSLYVNIFSILTITLSTYFLNKYYNIFSGHPSTNFFYAFFLGIVLFNIIFSSTKSGDVSFEQSKLEAVKSQLLFIMGIISIVVLFFHNIQDYTSDKKVVVLKVLVITFIINLVAIINVSVVQKGSIIRIVRKVKESLYLLIIYLTCIAFVYGFFYNKQTI